MGVADNDIIDQIRAGDARKYALLVDRHKDKVFTLAVRLVGNKSEAEELVQDGFMRAYRSLDRFRGDAKFSTWLYRIIYNLCMTRVTRRHTQTETSVMFHEEMIDGVFVDDGEVGVDEQMEQEEFNQIVREEVNLLPEKYRIAVTMFYLQEMSYQEMTEIMNLPIGTVKTNLFRGRNLLRKQMLVRMKGERV